MLGRSRGVSDSGDPAAGTTRVPGGLGRRMVLASAALAFVVAAMFAVFVVAVEDARDAESSALHSQDVVIAANGLERLVLDLETGQRGFILTRQTELLEPWHQALSLIHI